MKGEQGRGRRRTAKGSSRYRTQSVGRGNQEGEQICPERKAWKQSCKQPGSTREEGKQASPSLLPSFPPSLLPSFPPSLLPSLLSSPAILSSPALLPTLPHDGLSGRLRDATSVSDYVTARCLKPSTRGHPGLAFSVSTSSSTQHGSTSSAVWSATLLQRVSCRCTRWLRWRAPLHQREAMCGLALAGPWPGCLITCPTREGLEGLSLRWVV